MPFNQKILLIFSPWQLAFILTAFFALFSACGLIVVRRIISKHNLKVHNEIAGPIFGVMGTVYAVLLAFVVVITWENHDVTKQNIDKEVGALESLYVNAEAFQAPMKQELRADIGEYAEAIARDGWPKLKIGEESPIITAAIYKIAKLCASFEPKNKTEEIFLDKSIDRINELYELRGKRLRDSRNGIHPILWTTLIWGGVITIFISSIFESENRSLHIVTATSLSMLIVVALFIILELDFPFTGKLGIPPTAFQDLLARLKTY